MSALITPEQSADFLAAKGRALGEDWDDTDGALCERCEHPFDLDDLAALDGAVMCQPCIDAEVGSGPEHPRDI